MTIHTHTYSRKHTIFKKWVGGGSGSESKSASASARERECSWEAKTRIMQCTHVAQHAHQYINACCPHTYMHTLQIASAYRMCVDNSIEKRFNDVNCCPIIKCLHFVKYICTYFMLATKHCTHAHAYQKLVALSQTTFLTNSLQV